MVNMKIKECLDVSSIEVGLTVGCKIDLLDRLVDLAGNTGKIPDLDLVKKEIFDRERIMSTGVGKGVALPHAKTNSVEGFIASLAILKEPIDFDSFDGSPVNIAFLLVCKENNVGGHLRLLSRVSRFLNYDSFRNEIVKCQSPEQVLALFDEADD